MKLYRGIDPDYFQKAQVTKATYFDLPETSKDAFIWYYLRDQKTASLIDAPSPTGQTMLERAHFLAELFTPMGGREIDHLSRFVSHQLDQLTDALTAERGQGKLAPENENLCHVEALCSLASHVSLTEAVLHPLLRVTSWAFENQTGSSVTVAGMKGLLQCNPHRLDKVSPFLERVLRSTVSSIPEKETAMIALAEANPKALEESMRFLTRDLSQMDLTYVVREVCQTDRGPIVLGRTCASLQPYYADQLKKAVERVVYHDNNPMIIDKFEQSYERRKKAVAHQQRLNAHSLKR